MTKQCTHPSWKSIPNAKVQCELCGAVGMELRYFKPDDSDDQASLPQTLQQENERLAKAFEEVCEERDHWHSRSIISEVNEMALREDNARFKLNTSEALAAINDCSRPSEDGNSQLFWNWEVEYIAGLLRAALSLSSQETKQPEQASQSQTDKYRKALEFIADNADMRGEALASIAGEALNAI